MVLRGKYSRRKDNFFVLEVEEYVGERKPEYVFRVYEFQRKNQMVGFIKKMQKKNKGKCIYERYNHSGLRRQASKNPKVADAIKGKIDLRGENYLEWLLTVD